MRLRLLLTLSLAVPLAAWAKVYECLDGRGGIFIQDAPCHVIRRDVPAPAQPPSLPPPASSPVFPPERKEAPRHQAPSDDELPYQLASLNAEGFIPRDHLTVARFRSLLDQLATTYADSKQEIADTMVRARSLLKKDGIRESLLNITEAMNQLFITPIPNLRISDYAAAYVTLRQKGDSHADALRGLQGLFRSLGLR